MLELLERLIELRLRTQLAVRARFVHELREHLGKRVGGLIVGHADVAARDEDDGRRLVLQRSRSATSNPLRSWS